MVSANFVGTIFMFSERSKMPIVLQIFSDWIFSLKGSTTRHAIEDRNKRG